MSARLLVATALAATCTALVWAVFAHGQKVSELQAEQKRLQSENSPLNTPVAESLTTQATQPEVPRELLQLRAEVARLSQQQRELSGVRPENERLRLQLEDRRTNSAARKGIGAGYVRRSDAKWLGYGTPEDTIQSFFWAMQNHDLEKIFEAFTPEVAARGKEEIAKSGRSTEEIFNDKELPPAFRITGRQENGDGSVQLNVEITPDVPGQAFLFRQIGGQWKLQSPH
jgi:hypothetical protein